MAGSDRPVAGPAGSAPSFATPWATPVAVFAVLVGTLLAGLVWHATRLDPVDAWVMRWHVLAPPTPVGWRRSSRTPCPPV